MEAYYQIRSNGRKLLVRKNRNRIFKPIEWIEFLKHLKSKQIITFDFLMNTGARINEARNVKREDIDFKNNTINLKVTKDKKERKIHISSSFKNRLRKYVVGLKKNDYLPILSTPGGNIAMKKALQKAGIKDYYMFSIHSIRKTFETWLYCLRIEPTILFEHFGHKPTIAFERYIKGIPTDFDMGEKIQIRKRVGDLYNFF